MERHEQAREESYCDGSKTRLAASRFVLPKLYAKEGHSRRRYFVHLAACR